MASRLGSLLAAAWIVVSLVVSPALAQSTATYSYDELGRLKRVTSAAGEATYTIDNADNRTRLTSCVSACNHPPVANVDYASVAAGGTVMIPVLANDTDADSNPLTVIGVAGGSKGTPSLTSGSASVTYVAGAAQSGPDSFNYTISDGNGGTALGLVNITITNGTTTPPVAGPVSASVGYQSGPNGISPNLSGGPASSLAITGSPGKGTASTSGLGLTYTPGTGQTGYDTFSYSASGPGGTSLPANVTVNIGSPNNPSPPIAGFVSATVVNASGPNMISANLSGGPATSVTVVTYPGAGSVYADGLGFRYTATQVGTFTFDYNATGPGGTSPLATVSITVTANSASLAASVDSSSYQGVRNSGGWINGLAINVTPTGGSGTYSYAWEYVSGDTSLSVNGGGTAHATWQKPGALTPGVFTAVWRCKVTDSLGAVVYTSNVSVEIDEEP